MLPEHQLYEVAHQAAVQAYAPYSGFHVGAAIQLDDGRVFWASNQENKAYPSGICAERAVIYYVQANYPGHTIQKLLLVANHESLQTDEPVYPCGACRQVLAEFCAPDMPVFMARLQGGRVTATTLDALLPLAFRPGAGAPGRS